jgi:allantoicase
MANPILDPNAPAFTRRYMNLADPRLGAKALFASDEFFAPKERMLDPQPAVFIPGKYDDHGKWMDGWETRHGPRLLRRAARAAGHRAWCRSRHEPLHG